MSEPWTQEKAAKEALQLQNACNGTAVARTLHEIGRAFLHIDGYGTTKAVQTAPYKLTLMHLCFLSGITISDPANNYYQILEECERIANGGET
jgi:hypothetical protein